jgi:REP element-mobilizing transposase RayT
MVLAYHVIFSTYGFWLPNDPRGSCSVEVRYDPLKAFGEATTVVSHCSVAGKPHDRAKRAAAKRVMKYPEVVFDGPQAHSVGVGFRTQIRKSGYVVHACAIMPRHSHLVIARHTSDIEQVVRLCRQAATTQLLDDGRHPFAAQRSARGRLPSVWGQDFWKVFLYEPEDVGRAVRYVEENPPKEKLPHQTWTFVTPPELRADMPGKSR